MTDDADALTQRILDHWSRIIPAAPLERSPFDHVFFDGMFPEDVYRTLLARFPDKSAYEPINIKRWVNAEGVSTRDRIKLTEAGIARMAPELRPFWTAIMRALTSAALKRLVFAHLAQDLALRLGCAPEEVNARDVFVGASLTRDIEDYRIKPHPDGYPRAATMQLYLPADEGQADLGTSLYVEQPLWKRALGQRYREVKRMPFRPNSGYCFAVNDVPEKRSLHGRERIGPHSGVRNTILVSWYVEQAAVKKSSSADTTPVWDAAA
jgi:hypothetical protein